MDEVDGVGEFGAAVEALDKSLGEAQVSATECHARFTELGSAVSDAGREVNILSGGISSSLRRSFDGLLLDGMRLSDALQSLGQSMVTAAYSAAVKPVTSHVGGMLAGGMESFISGLLPFEKGASFSQGRVMRFARGGVVSAPVSFPMRGGVGMMGEAGPEAILPLARGADGRLGVQAGGAQRPVSVVMNVTTPDAESFRRSQSQIAAQMGRALGRGQRNR